MTKFFHDHSSDDEELVHFLKNYCPLTPMASSDTEEQLFRAIAQEKRSSHNKYFSWRWAIPTSLITGMLIFWGVSTSQKLTPQVAQEEGELDAFIMEVWSYSSMDPNQEFDPDSDFVTLGNEF